MKRGNLGDENLDNHHGALKASDAIKSERDRWSMYYDSGGM